MISRYDVIHSSAAVNEVASLIIKNIPRTNTNEESPDETIQAQKNSKKTTKSDKLKNSQRNNGWRLPKFHSLFYTTKDLLDFGTAENKDGGAGEEGHKETVKKHGHRTSRVQSSFATQVAFRNGESVLVRRLFSRLKKEIT